MGADRRQFTEPLRQFGTRHETRVMVLYSRPRDGRFSSIILAFTLGIGEKFPVADEGGGPARLRRRDRSFPASRITARRWMADEVRHVVLRTKTLDTVCFAPFDARAPDKPGGGWPDADHPARSASGSSESLGAVAATSRQVAAARPSKANREDLKVASRDRRPFASGERASGRGSKTRHGHAVSRAIEKDQSGFATLTHA